jgi:hypothetical protein
MKVELAVVAVAVALASCSSTGIPNPPPNAGTLTIHAEFQAGPVGGDGHAAVESSMSRTRVRVRQADSGAISIVTTDRAGNAKLRLAPGRYYATFADLQGFNGKGGDLTCGLGAPRTKTVRLSPRGTAHLEIVCGEP